jgi:hypothetical protein
MTPSSSTAGVARPPQFAWTKYQDTESAMTHKTPVQELGFPGAQSSTEPADPQRPLCLSDAVLASAPQTGGFEALPVVLVAQIVIAYLGALEWAAVKHLAQQYPGHRDAICGAVNADPVFQSLSRLLPPIRTIAVRDLLARLLGDISRLKPELRSFARLSPSEDAHLAGLEATRAFYEPKMWPQTRLANNNLRSGVWLPLVERLVQHRVPGVRPEHTDLLALCDRMLAGQMPDLAQGDAAVRSARAIGLDVKQWRDLLLIACCHEPGRDPGYLNKGIAVDRNDVLRDAFARIANAFAVEAGWTLEPLLAHSQSDSLTGPAFEPLPLIGSGSSSSAGV